MSTTASSARSTSRKGSSPRESALARPTVTGRSHCVTACLIALIARPAVAQQRPLDTQDAEPIGGGQVRVETGVTFARDAFYPLSGLKGNLWQLPVVRFVIGLS